MTPNCIFCEIVAGRSPADFVSNDRKLPTVIFRPLNPVTEGHVLVVPRQHITAAHSDSIIASDVMEHAAIYAAGVGPYNLITSFGIEATQTIFHLHLHVVPRRAGDGLRLPWTLRLLPGDSPFPGPTAEANTAGATDESQHRRGKEGLL